MNGNGSIPVGTGASPESFELPNLESLNVPPVNPNQTPGSAEGGQPLQVEIDPRFKDLPEKDALIRTFQSKYDILNADFIKTQKEFQTVAIYKDILADLYDSDDALYAFLNERKPELISSRDIKTEVTKRLTAKGYEGYEPQLSRDEAERKDPGGKDWQFYKELDKITAEVTGAGSYAKHKNLKEFRDLRKAEIDSNNAVYEQEIAETKEKLKMSDAEVEWTRKWTEKAKFSELVSILRFIRTFKNAPVMSNIPGSQGPVLSQDRQQFLKSLQ